MGRPFQVRVWPLPQWLDWRQLLGPGQWTAIEKSDGVVEAQATLERNATADLAARLRGVGIGGSLLHMEISPPLHRKDLRKAYAEEARRYRDGSTGFSRRSTRLDDEARKSLTPEALALALGERARDLRVIDACAGAGGNAIGFARTGCTVVAIEINESRLAMARHNAKLYGVADRIEFVAGDACSILPERDADLLFIDPPWGERYNKKRVTLSDLPPCEDLLQRANHLPKHWIKVPPSFDPSTLPGYCIEAFFGVARGDERRVKFLLLEKKPVSTGRP
jgi:SAM-dependent methyltransferase